MSRQRPLLGVGRKSWRSERQKTVKNKEGRQRRGALSRAQPIGRSHFH